MVAIEQDTPFDLLGGQPVGQGQSIVEGVDAAEPAIGDPQQAPVVAEQPIECGVGIVRRQAGAEFIDQLFDGHRPMQQLEGLDLNGLEGLATNAHTGILVPGTRSGG